MKKVLFAYSTNEGQTYKILKTINQQVEGVCNVDYYNLKKQDDEIDLSIYDYIIVASSIRYGKYSKQFYKFINKHADVLNSKDSTFMSVNLTARKPGKDDPATSAYIKKFKRKSKWKPTTVQMFAGLLDYPKYGPLDKSIIRFIMWLTKGETDTSKTVEYTDWKKVEAFADSIKERLK
tara:strand:- start:2244 stop:2777 length:534 start_codon:yes stop_codon:yes gene_type:complete